MLQQHLAQLGVPSVETAGQPEALSKDHRWVVYPLGQPVQERAELVKRVLDRSGEQLLLGLEVVVERAHPHVGSLSDLEDGNADPARRDERLGSLDQRRTSACLAALKTGRGNGSDGTHLARPPTRFSQN